MGRHEYPPKLERPDRIRLQDGREIVTADYVNRQTNREVWNLRTGQRMAKRTRHVTGVDTGLANMYNKTD